MLWPANQCLSENVHCSPLPYDERCPKQMFIELAGVYPLFLQTAILVFGIAIFGRFNAELSLTLYLLWGEGLLEGLFLIWNSASISLC